jgi:hypothetical protein
MEGLLNSVFSLLDSFSCRHIGQNELFFLDGFFYFPSKTKKAVPEMTLPFLLDILLLDIL